MAAVEAAVATAHPPQARKNVMIWTALVFGRFRRVTSTDVANPGFGDHLIHPGGDPLARLGNVPHAVHDPGGDVILILEDRGVEHSHQGIGERIELKLSGKRLRKRTKRAFEATETQSHRPLLRPPRSRSSWA